MLQSARKGEPKERVERFDPVERTVHWSTGLFVLCVITTGTILYVPSFSVAVGHRLVLENTHVFVGLAMFVPFLVAALGPWGKHLRRDIRAMSHFSRGEVGWLRTLGRTGRSEIGKFNPGQKLNSSGLSGMLVVLLFTGVILRWGTFLPVSLRTGATFIHDLFAFLLTVTVAGHVAFAAAHPQTLRAMVVGWVPSGWARRHAPAWTEPGSSPVGPGQASEGPPGGGVPGALSSIERR